MVTNNNILEITCPKCGDVHKYSLEVKRSMFIEMMTVNTDFSEVRKSYKRLFTCPKTEEDFQAVISLSEARHARIESVEVKGLVKEEEDADE